MKKIFLALAITGICSFSYAQTGHSENDGHNHGKVIPSDKTNDVVKLVESEYDFGKIPQGKPVYHEFQIVNTGATPLKLDNVSASCGCTTPEWSRDAIAPGATSKIRVGYNSAAEGPFEKYITIIYNNNNQTKQLKIKGNVWRAPEGSAPTNASVDFLKKQSL